ncbi:hypothetical protein HJC23_002874 [Cyclotella cryptica]|uniref:Secreted protein n=1 Tax=Cyclotella cryptica TaxID=29204 RepID=A0ABD3PK20_9STRA|eukprot:CCRYP_013826-RA/>CCRYP_013826-RA protein AED:0.03 eAED:0.03 QI:0/-1/0/1/-1/1/1/0/570
MKVTQLGHVVISLHGVAASLLHGDSERSLAVLYYPKYDPTDFNKGYCTSNPAYQTAGQGYSTELACCKAYFNGQKSGLCYSKLPNPPTVSPTAKGGGVVNVWYADYSLDWTKGKCINKAPIPNGRQTYDTQLACCKGSYAGQASGACLATLPNPPTVSPTAKGGGVVNVWYADYSLDWTKGKCINKAPIPNGRQTYDTQLACCKGSYAGQASGACLATLPNPPTVSPTAKGGGVVNLWYADYSLDWTKGKCINKAPIPNGRQTYDTQLACCKGSYAGQASGVCLATLPNPPTVSPTAKGGGVVNVWYADYSLDWTKGKCINKAPIPNGRQTYDTQLACCKGSYAGQASGTCLATLPNPPTVSPTAKGGGVVNVWYADYSLDWTKGKCINKAPIPNGRQTYDTQLACCKGSYAGQASGTCLATLPNPPTVSPTAKGGGVVNIWYADYSLDWTKGKCINKAPIPNGRQTYDTQLACCKGSYAGQASGACLGNLPKAPTASPIGTKSKFFPIWSGWETGYCDNDPTKLTGGNSYLYDTQAECCDAWFSGQASNACLRYDPTYGSRSPTQAPIQ